jgi:hypothetical protein
MNMSMLTKGPWPKGYLYFLLVNLIRMTYLIVYQIENPIKLNKKLTTLVKMALMGPNQV